MRNSPDERGRPHLWGHVQEAALIDAAVALDRQDLRQVAVSSASAVFTEVIESGFDLPHVHAYDVQPAAFVLDRLAAGDRAADVQGAGAKGPELIRRPEPGSDGHIRPRDWPSRGRT